MTRDAGYWTLILIFAVLLGIAVFVVVRLVVLPEAVPDLSNPVPILTPKVN